MKSKKSPRDSAVEMRELVMPNHTNPQGTIFGGQIMAWVDIAAAMAAARHCRAPVVTVHVDELSFKAPVKMGDHVLIKAMVNYVGQTSLEVGVKVQSEDPTTGETQITTSAYLTFVCLDENRKPAKVPGILVKSKDEIRRFKNAQKRVQSRKRLAKMIHKK